MKDSNKYNPSEIEGKWQKVWIENRVYQPDLASAKRPYYNLMMFPYPSAEGLHVGNMYAFTGADINGRYQRMRGFDVFEPIGLDGFGIHSENYAIKIGKHPKEQAKVSEKNFYRQLHAIGNGFAWENALETYDPDYYRWTQWIFTRMFKAGLAYRKKSPVNFCPSCKTVLSDEQVIEGACERCKSTVEKKEMEQWYFAITKYADRLLKNLETLQWTNKVKVGQRNWIGKAEGLIEYWQVEGMDLKLDSFTTWPHTTWGATFIVIAPEHPVIKKLVAGTAKEKEAEKFCAEVIAENKKDPLSATKVKKGFFTGRYAINHLTSEKMKIFIANFAVMGFGTGIVKCCPAHDGKDFEFARKYELEIRPVIVPEGGKSLDGKTMKEAFIGEGIMENAGKFSGMSTKKARKEISDLIVSSGHGKVYIQYHLRDWCISRQRYWGAPIPMIFCEKCQWQPVPDKDLPVLLPDLSDWKPEGTGKGPLAKLPDFVNVACPECGGAARRETDVCDTFLDSSWYHMRYPSIGIANTSDLETGDASGGPPIRVAANTWSEHEVGVTRGRTRKLNLSPWDPVLTKKWLPVTQYIGGAEHTVLHLLYARFVAMVFKDLGKIDFEEPYTKFYAHGLIIAEGAKMSKSKGNVVVPDAYIAKYGADTLRTYLMFLGPFDGGGDFRDTGIAGMYRFLTRVWRLATDVINTKLTEESSKLEKIMHKAVKEVTEDMENFRYNTAIAHIMEYVNQLTEQKEQVTKKNTETLLLLIAPFAPHMTEELFEAFKKDQNASIHQTSWPKYDPKYLVEDEVVIIVQVNGKIRDTLKVPFAMAQGKQSEVEKLAQESEKVEKYLEGKKIKKVIFVPSKLINFVI